MKDFVDFAELFQNLPTEGAQRSTEPQHTGWCWFGNQGQSGYPDTALIKAYVDDADIPVDDDAGDTGDEFGEALGAASFSMNVGDDGAREATHDTELGVAWHCNYSVGPSRMRWYSVKSAEKSMFHV